MRRYISGILCFLMLFSLLAIPPVTADATTGVPENAGVQSLADNSEETSSEGVTAQAETEEFPKSGYVNGNSVRVRSGAGTSYSVVYTLDKNAPVTIHKQESANDLEWGQLDDGNWIALKYVTFTATQKMTSSQAFIDILKKREGFSAKPYWDVSHYSIGYGTSVPSSKVDYYNKNPITEAEGEAMMREHLLDFEEAVLNFAEKYSLTFTQNQFDALVSFCYNCGDSWLRETNGNMNRAVREGWKGSDFVYAMCLWSKAGSDYILMNRRMYEANMYLNNKYESPYDYENGTFRYVFLEAGQGTVRYMVHGFDTADPKPVRYEITKYPTGVDKDGNPFTYTFAGWYTAKENGVKVENLDTQIENSALLYAMWKDPDGNVQYLEKGVACNNIKVTIKNVDSTVNVRSGPGTYYAKIGTIKKGTVVTLTHIYDDGKNQWGRYEGGWFSLEYSDYDGSVSGDQPEEIFPQYGIVNTDGVNVRSGAGTSNASQYKLNTGDPVTILQKTTVGSMVWGQLEDGNWISMTYVTLSTNPVDPDPEPEPDPEPDPEPVPVETISDDGLEIIKMRTGFTSTPYKQPSGWYVGYRKKIEESEVAYYQANPLTLTQAETYLLQDLAPIEAAILAFRDAKELQMTQNRFDALVAYSFSLGTAWLNDPADCMYRAVAEGWTGSNFLYAVFARSKLEKQYGLVTSHAIQANIYLNNTYSLNYNFTTGNYRYVFLEAGQGEVDHITVGFDITDPTEILSQITETPSGYTFAGWYTAPENGTKVETLNDQIPNASVLYAMWKNASGMLTYLESSTPCVAIEVTVNSPDGDIYPKTGHGAFYPSGEKISAGAKLLITDTYDDGDTLWGRCETVWVDLGETNYEELEKPEPKEGIITGDNVNVRNSPGTDGLVQYKLSKGTLVKIYRQLTVGEMQWGRLEDGNWVALSYVSFDTQPDPGPEPDPKPEENSGDMDGSGGIDKDDAIYLLRHVVYPEQYPLTVNGDVDGNGKIDKDDAIYLLRHVVYPEQYPLNYGE